MDTYYDCRLITYQKTFYCTWRRAGKWAEGGKNRAGLKKKSEREIGKWDWKIDREDKPCICVVNLNGWRQTRGEWRNSLAVQMGEQWLGQYPVFCLVFTNTQQEREWGRVLAAEGCKLPVIDAYRRGGRQLKTCGAHRWPLSSLPPPSFSTAISPTLTTTPTTHN